MAVIISKQAGGKAVMKAVPFSFSREEERLAHELDILLSRRIPEIERELSVAGLIPSEGNDGRRGSTELWWKLGRKLAPIVENKRLVKPSEQHLLWDAIKMYGSPRILRGDRGSTRIHLEYCYRLGKLSWELVEQMHWDDWVFYFDSKSLRQERRIDLWLSDQIGWIHMLSREQFRDLAKRLNARFKNKDTEVFTNRELFAICNEVLATILARPVASPPLSRANVR
jgi:hypothetical protein